MANQMSQTEPMIPMAETNSACGRLKPPQNQGPIVQMAESTTAMTSNRRGVFSGTAASIARR